jgi:outer membrane protein TolC
VRLAQESVARNERIVEKSRQSASDALEALRITEIAYRAGATTNIEVVQAQQTARNVEIIAALAEDALRQARLGLLVALGRFPR